MKFPIVTISISIILVGLLLIYGAMPNALIWQQSSPISWQLITSHFAHISNQHMLWNLVAFIFLAYVIELHSITRLLTSIFVGCTFVSFYLLFLFKLPAYAGLSGVLNTLLVVALYEIAKKVEYRKAALLCFSASVVKILFEWSNDSSLFSSLEWPGVPAAHLAGLLGGICYCLFLHKNDQLFSSDQLRPKQRFT